MKTKLSLIPLALTLMAVSIGCSTKEACPAGERADALDASAWNESSWISVAAPLVFPEENEDKAADGASWFMSTLKNEGKVVSAKWMATSLGVFEIYVNGTPIGEEVLKPGFTHREKTKLMRD